MNIMVNPSRILNLRVVSHGLDAKTDALNLSIDDLRAVPTPDCETRITKNGNESISWMPIPHATLVEQFLSSLEQNNLGIVAREDGSPNYSLNLGRDGQRFFGLFQVSGIQRAADQTHIGTVIGLRNSHDKSFPASICAGDAPFVCTNLAFSNEIRLGRKHTAFILRDLPQLIMRGVAALNTHWHRQDVRIDAYRAYALGDSEAHHLTIQAFRNGAISKTQIADVVTQWHTPEHDEFADRNGYSFYNAFTNVLRGNLNALNARSDALHATLDSAFGVSAGVDEAFEVIG